uniref:ATP synthase complex subunit 8 n=1 Tax=Dorysthenes granulosus TaxID=690275 RepID=A0A6M5A143_9CUCU|nr:ATP synthase F0 subunit 8 [Dorysthenes granulosus]
MPQMAPLNWITLFFYFTIMFIIFNSINYFNFIYPIKKISLNSKKIKFNWKW